jgi:putative protease
LNTPQVRPNTPLPASAKIPELLAPAGGREAFLAALHTGADAVFLGLDQFNARSRARNFNIEELAELLPLARQYGMKVLVTVNVVVKEVERRDLCELLSRLEPLGIHALIVQDAGVLRLVKTHFPSFRLHASTQMALHNLDGILEARRLGFRRVVLARELTAQEVGRLRESTPSDTELEVFCHGSLCYSYSGLCFFSGAQDARSGNRGECAYTCREPYRIVSENGRGFLFSMKDLDTADAVGLWVRAGVDALKIEGRKKDAQYVATAVALYRHRLDALFGKSTLRTGAPMSARAFASQPDGLHEFHDYTFHRAPTGFHVKGRYAENVIDLDEPSHKGVLAGAIESVEDRWIRIQSRIALSHHDGLRVDPPGVLYHAEPQHGAPALGADPELPAQGGPESTDRKMSELEARFENQGLRFGIHGLRVDGRTVFESAAGLPVWIQVPEGHALPNVGDLVRKTRSDALRQRVDALARPGADERLRILAPVETRIAIAPEEGGLRVTVAIHGPRGIVARESILAKAERPRGPSKLPAILENLFSVYGEAGFESTRVEVEGDSDYFIPPSMLKGLKQKLSQSLSPSQAALISHAADEALASWVATEPPSPSGPSTLAVKFDRPELASALREYMEGSPALAIHELIFEPKRMYLDKADPIKIWGELLTIAKSWGATLRLALPPVIRPWDAPHLKAWIRLALAMDKPAFELGNLGSLGMVRRFSPGAELPQGVSLATDFFLYALNAQASRFWAEAGFEIVTLSIEDDREDLAAHLSRFPFALARPRAILYKDTPLFIAEACTLTALHDGCPGSKACGYRTLEIENTKGERFQVAHEQCKSIVYGEEAFSIADRRGALEEMGIHDFRVDFLTRPYTTDAALAVLRSVDRAETMSKTHVANFGRSLL